jgi:hypothetical protein
MTYRGARVALATKHGKEQAIVRPLHELAGIEVVVADGIDTDALGTFTGEVERKGTMLETAIAKARLGSSCLGLPFGVASEGSFGPHPSAPILAVGYELLVFVDDAAHVVIREERMETETNFSHLVVSDMAATEPWLIQIGFPQHAVIVRPNLAKNTFVIAKGLTNLEDVERAIALASKDSSDGCARLETDMRAHLNPTRMRSIAQLAASLGERLARLCPACTAPGYGRTDVIRGLPCSACGYPSAWIKFERWTCAQCSFARDVERPDGLSEADPEHCQLCNP